MKRINTTRHVKVGDTVDNLAVRWCCNKMDGQDLREVLAYLQLNCCAYIINDNEPDTVYGLMEIS